MTEIKHYERLTCGHQNNLLLAGNKEGVCPKGCLVINEGKINEEPVKVKTVAYRKGIEVNCSWDKLDEELEKIALDTVSEK